MEKKPLCVLVNDQFCWLLIVDNHEIAFQGSYNADYFEHHYKSAGYEVKRRTNTNMYQTG